MMLKFEAKSAQSRKKTSSNGNLVLDSVRKKKERWYLKKKKNVKSPEIQYENSLYRLNELRILQRPLCCYWSVSYIVLQSDHTFCFYFCFFVQSNWKLPFETKLHVLLSLRELLEGWTIFWPLSYKIKMKNPAIKETKIWS